MWYSGAIVKQLLSNLSCNLKLIPYYITFDRYSKFFKQEENKFFAFVCQYSRFSYLYELFFSGDTVRTQILFHGKSKFTTVWRASLFEEATSINFALFLDILF